MEFSMSTHTTDSQVPPLPDYLPPESGGEFFDAPPTLPGPIKPVPPISIRSIRCGCWLINYQPVSSALVTYDGTLRVECHSAGRTASGDLYQRRFGFFPPVPLPGPNPANGIPILAQSRYRFYIRVTSLPEKFFLS